MPVCVYVCVSTLRLLITSGVIWTLYNCINNFYNFYMVAVVVMVMGMALELKCFIETNLIIACSYKMRKHG